MRLFSNQSSAKQPKDMQENKPKSSLFRSSLFRSSLFRSSLFRRLRRQPSPPQPSAPPEPSTLVWQPTPSEIGKIPDQDVPPSVVLPNSLLEQQESNEAASPKTPEHTRSMIMRASAPPAALDNVPQSNASNVTLPNSNPQKSDPDGKKLSAPSFIA